MPTQCYHEGEFWAATGPVPAGHSPTTHPEEWQRIEVPLVMGPLVVQCAIAALLRGDGQLDKALAEEKTARELIEEAKYDAAKDRQPTWRRPRMNRG